MRQIKGRSLLSLVVAAFASAALAAPASKAPAPAPKAAAPAPAPAPAPVAAPAPAPAPVQAAPAPMPAPAPTAVTTKPMNTEMLAERTTADSEMMNTAEYSTRGGTALGKGSAIRAQISAGTANGVNVAQMSLEGGFLMSIQRNADFGVNLRIPLTVPGLSVGATLRWNFVNDGKLHLAAIGNLNLPLGFSSNPTIGLGIEPGIVGSYEVTDKAEFFTALLVSYNQVIWQRAPVLGGRAPGFNGTLRTGMSYALMSKAGLFVNFDLMAGYEPIRRNISIGDRFSGLAFGASLTAGFQMSL